MESRIVGTKKLMGGGPTVPPQGSYSPKQRISYLMNLTYTYNLSTTPLGVLCIKVL